MRTLDYFNALGPEAPIPFADAAPIEQTITQSRLNRILAFTGLTIDDVVNDPIAKNQVKGYYRLSRQIDRQIEVTELEEQWNSVGRRRT